MSRPLPNDVFRPGDVCPRSFAGRPTENVDPLDPPVEGWGVCRSCGETVNTRGRYLPEHRLPEEPEP